MDLVGVGNLVKLFGNRGGRRWELEVKGVSVAGAGAVDAPVVLTVSRGILTIRVRVRVCSRWYD